MKKVKNHFQEYYFKYENAYFCYGIFYSNCQAPGKAVIETIFDILILKENISPPRVLISRNLLIILGGCQFFRWGRGEGGDLITSFVKCEDPSPKVISRGVNEIFISSKQY